jgi:hypothetical protein
MAAATAQQHQLTNPDIEFGIADLNQWVLVVAE